MPRLDAQKSEVGIYSFGRLIPRDYPIVSTFTINVTGMRDPQSSGGFRRKFTDGRADEIQDYIRDDDRYPAILDNVEMLAQMYLRSEGKSLSWLSFAFMDNHGKWAGPAFAEAIAEDLSDLGYRVHTFHHDVLRGGK